MFSPKELAVCRTILMGFVLGLLVLTVPSLSLAAKATPLIATFDELPSDTFSTGVTHDENDYAHGVDGIKVYFGVNGRNVVLVTYNTPRMLHFVFDHNSSAFNGSGLSWSDFYATVDLFGINYFGPYMTMGIGTTAQVQMDLEFYVGRLTYELDYQSLAAIRLDERTWLITSNPNDIPGNPGFVPSDQAALNVIRRRSQESFGTVNMPIRFSVTLQ